MYCAIGQISVVMGLMSRIVLSKRIDKSLKPLGLHKFVKCTAENGKVLFVENKNKVKILNFKK